MIRSLPSAIRRLGRERSATTSTEFAVTALPLVILLFGVVEVGSVIRVKSAMHYAVTQAARCASVNAASCGTANAVATYAASQTLGFEVHANSFTVATDTCGKKVSATIPIPVSGQSVLKTGLSFTVHACYPLQPSCRAGDLVTPNGLPGVCRD